MKLNFYILITININKEDKMFWSIYILGAIIAFILIIGVRIIDGKLTLGDLVCAILFSAFSWIVVLIFIILSIDELDNFVIWRKK